MTAIKCTGLRTLALGAVLGLASALPAQGIVLKDRLPADTLLYLGVPNIMKSVEDFKSMPLYKLWMEKEVQDFLKQPMSMLDKYMGMGKAELDANLKGMGLPLTADEVMAMRPGSLHYALIGMGGEGEMLRFAVTMSMAKGAATMDKLVGFGRKMLEARLQHMEQQFGEKNPMKGMQFIEMNGYQALVVDTTAGKGPFKSMTIAYKDGQVVFASSKALATRILGAPVEGGLSSTADFKKCFANLRAQDAEMEVFLRPAGLIKATRSFLSMVPDRKVRGFIKAYGDKIDRGLAASGLLGMEAMASASTYLDGKAAADSYLLAPAPRTGFLTLFEGTPVNLEHLKWVPAKASTVHYGAMPLSKLIDTVIGIIGAADENFAKQIPMMLMGLEKQTGVHVKRDLIDLIGGKFIFYMGTASGFSVPPIVAMMEVKNHEKVINSMETLLALTQGAATIEKIKDPTTGLDIWTLNLDIPMNMPFNPMDFIQPSFAFKNGFMVMALNGRDVISTLNMMDGTGRNITENPELKAMLATLPKEATGLSFTDMKGSMRSYYELGTGALSMLGTDLPIDVAQLPDSDTVVKHFFAATGYTVTSKEGFLTRTTSPIGPEMVLGIMGAYGAAAAFFMSADSPFPMGGRARRAPAARVKEVQPKTAPAGRITKAEKTKTQDDFDEISTLLVIYQIETGKYPPSLDTLLKPFKDYPEPLITSPKMLLDPWGNKYLYKKVKDGFLLWSVGPNGKDEGGKGDDIVRKR